MGIKETLSGFADEYQKQLTQEKEARFNNGIQGEMERERLKKDGDAKFKEAVDNGEIVRRR